MTLCCRPLRGLGLGIHRLNSSRRINLDFLCKAIQMLKTRKMPRRPKKSEAQLLREIAELQEVIKAKEEQVTIIAKKPGREQHRGGSGRSPRRRKTGRS